MLKKIICSVIPPDVLKGNINAPKFKKMLGGSALQHAPPRYPADLKRLAPFSNRPWDQKRVRSHSGSSDDLRNRLDRKNPKLYSVTVHNLPDKINGDRELIKLLASGYGVVEEVNCIVETKTCEIVFRDKDLANKFYEAKNEQTYEGTILKCQPPILLE